MHIKVSASLDADQAKIDVQRSISTPHPCLMLPPPSLELFAANWMFYRSAAGAGAGASAAVAAATFHGRLAGSRSAFK